VTRSYPPLSWLVPLLAPLYRWLDRVFARRADRIVAISKMVRDDCRRVYGRDDIRTAGPGVDPPAPELVDPGYLRRRLRIDTRHVLVTVGKLIPKKNFDMFVRVVKELRDRGRDVGGVIIGDGPLRDEIEGLIVRLGLEGRCLMTGFLREYEEVLRYMSGATIYMYLERNVPFGLTPVEAGSLGVPVVAYEGGGADETIVPGENGRKLPAGYGSEEIADVVEELLEAPEGVLAEMGDAGRTMAARWSWEAAYDRFLEGIGAVERPV
jgi:phosphatidylinositol alpha-1,6-mannosyltransferase